MKITTLTLLIAMVLMPVLVRALTLEESLARAFARNSALKSSDADSVAAKEEVNVTRTALLPSLKARGFYNLADNYDRLIIDSGIFGQSPSQKYSVVTGDKETYGIGVSLRQHLFAGGSLVSSHDRAGRESAASSHAFSRMRTLLAFQVRKTFNEALIADCRIRAAEKNLQAAEERLRVTQARQLEGYVDRVELLRREADSALAETRLIKARNRSALLVSRLRQLIGAMPDEELVVSGRAKKLTLTAALNEVMKGGLERRDDIKGASEKTAAATAGVQVARSGYFPQLFLEGNYLRQKETNIDRPEIWSVSMQAEWSLFEWGRTSAEVRKAVARRSQSDFAREELSRSARLEIEEAWRDVIELQSLVKAHEKGVLAGEAALVSMIEKYGEGSVRQDDVISNEAALWEVYDSYCHSVAAVSSAFAALEAATSMNLDQWTIMEELYRPDFESYSARITELAVSLMKKPTSLSAVSNLLTPGASHVKPQLGLHKTDKPFSAKQEIASIPTESPAQVRRTKRQGYRLQLGAYKSEQSAKERLEALASHFSGKELELLAEGDLVKPVVGPFGGIVEAIKAAEAIGISDYMIRSSNEPRAVSP